ALRVPVAYGGPGASLRDLFDVVIRLAAADSTVAQSLRAPFQLVEGRGAAADEAERARWLPEVLAGRLFGNATVERTTRDMFGFQTKCVRAGGELRLRGTKYYSTGSLYADRVSVAAVGPEGGNGAGLVTAEPGGVVPAEHRG